MDAPTATEGSMCLIDGDAWYSIHREMGGWVVVGPGGSEFYDERDEMVAVAAFQHHIEHGAVRSVDAAHRYEILQGNPLFRPFRRWRAWRTVRRHASHRSK